CLAPGILLQPLAPHQRARAHATYSVRGKGGAALAQHSRLAKLPAGSISRHVLREGGEPFWRGSVPVPRL
ncbi:unnamed protein product, partial [Effrenium voratum]